MISIVVPAVESLSDTAHQNDVNERNDDDCPALIGNFGLAADSNRASAANPPANEYANAGRGLRQVRAMLLF